MNHITQVSQSLLSRLRSCVEDYNMISPGDKVAVGLSGGKDSLVTLAALAKLAEFYPVPFTVGAITVSMTQDASEYDGLQDFCRDIGCEYILIPTDIREIVFERRKETNPCSLCANMRRGALHRAAVGAGYTKVALGHHRDDAVETFLLSLLYEGRISCFSPVTELTRTGITVLRPMLYCSEREMRGAAKKLPCEVVTSSCPAAGKTKRQDTKELLLKLQSRSDHLNEKIFGSMQRLPLPGWEKHPRVEPPFRH